MEILVHDKSIDIGLVRYPPMNFGQIRCGLKTLPYLLSIHPAEFLTLMEQPYDQFVAENIVDDKANGFTDVITVLFESNYRTSRNMFSYSPEKLCAVIRDYLFLEFLEAAIGNNSANDCVYSLITLACLRYDNGLFLAEGLAFDTATPY